MDTLSPVHRFNGLLDFVCVEPASVTLNSNFEQVLPFKDAHDDTLNRAKSRLLLDRQWTIW